MLSTSRFSFLVVVLAALYVLSSCNSSPPKLQEGNIDVNSEIYIVPVEPYLFDVESGLQADLDTENVKKVSQAFGDKEIELSNRISIEKKTDYWLVWDEKKNRKYAIRKENDELNVYNYIDEKYLYPLIPRLEKRFTTKVHLAMDKRISISDDVYDYEAKKYVAPYILAELIKVEVPDNAKILGVTNVDIYLPQSEYDFIFGQAQYGKNSKAAIISTLRMDPSSYVGGKPDDKLLADRMVKTAIHQLGHVFGLRNCAEPECVMYLPRSLKSLDKKTDNFCMNCQKEWRLLEKPENPVVPSGK